MFPDIKPDSLYDYILVKRVGVISHSMMHISVLCFNYQNRWELMGTCFGTKLCPGDFCHTKSIKDIKKYMRSRSISFGATECSPQD